MRKLMSDGDKTLNDKIDTSAQMRSGSSAQTLNDKIDTSAQTLNEIDTSVL